MLFFFNDTATTEIYTLSLHDALPIFPRQRHLMPLLMERLLQQFGHPPLILDDQNLHVHDRNRADVAYALVRAASDRKSTRLNSSHSQISYAVFCLKKTKVQLTIQISA